MEPVGPPGPGGQCDALGSVFWRLPEIGPFVLGATMFMARSMVKFKQEASRDPQGRSCSRALEN
eukprot:1248799-Pyramimonas_sp.AAC.1